MGIARIVQIEQDNTIRLKGQDPIRYLQRMCMRI